MIAFGRFVGLVLAAGPLVSLWCVSAPAGADEPQPAKATFEGTDQYDVRQVDGWNVYLNRRFERDEPELCRDVLTLLEHQLYQIRRMVPSVAVEQLQQVAVWIELAEPHHLCMCYHPDPGWLRTHDMNPDKARCIEIAN